MAFPAPIHRHNKPVRRILHFFEANWRQRNHTAKSRRAFIRRDIFQQAQQFCIVICIGRILFGIHRGKPCGINARRAIERIHFQPGIIRQNEIGQCDSVASFDPSQLASSTAFFVALPANVSASSIDFGASGKSFEREKLELLSQDGADFRDFVRVARGNKDGCHTQTPINAAPMTPAESPS